MAMWSSPCCWTEFLTSAVRRTKPVLVALVFGAGLACAQSAEPLSADAALPLGCDPRLETVAGKLLVSYNADECSETGRKILDSITQSLQTFAGDSKPDDLSVERLRRLLRREFHSLGQRKRDIEDWISRVELLEASAAELAAETKSKKASAAAKHLAARQLAAGRDALDEWIDELAKDSAATERLRSRAFAARARAQELQGLASTALPWWKRALEAMPGDVKLRLEQARILTAMRKSDDSLAAYMELLDEDLAPDDKADALENIAYAYVAKGMNGAASSVLRQALEIREAFALEEPAQQRPRIARLRHGLSARYTKEGRFEPAISELEKAIALYRDSMRDSHGAYRQELADVLWTASMNYVSLRQLGKAGAAVTEALKLYEEIASDVPDASTPGVPQALNTLGLAHLRANNNREAVYYFAESVRILRAQLRKRNVYWVRSSLATSLSSLGDGYRLLNREDDALATLDEALAINRDLAAADPPRHLPSLAQTLSRKGAVETGRGRHGEAASLFGESAQIYRTLSRENPRGFREPLAASLGNLGAALLRMRELEAAIEAVTEAVGIQEGLYRDRPEVEAGRLLDYYLLLGSIQRSREDCPTALLTLARAREIRGAEKRALELNRLEQSCALETL